MTRLVFWIAYAYIASQVLDSLVRWSLSLVHLTPLIYLRDGALFLLGALALGRIAVLRTDCRRSVALLAAIVCGMTVSVLAGLPTGQAVFGLKIWLPFIVGFLMADAGILEYLDRPRPWFFLWLIACIGVALNFYLRYPWTGMSFEIGDLEVTGNREWTTFGWRRLSGFGRSSYDTAMALLLLYLYLSVVARRNLSRLLITIATGGTIALTTSKGAIGSYLIIAAALPLLMTPASASGRKRLALISVAFGFALVGGLLPLWSAVSPMPRFEYGTAQQKLFASLVARGWETWPNAFDLLHDWQHLFGKGFGGIGVAQKIFEAKLANPADNFIVYLYVSFGVLGVAMYVYLAFGMFRNRCSSRGEQLAYLASLTIFSYGMTASLIENSIFGALCGISLHVASRSASRRPAMTTSRPTRDSSAQTSGSTDRPTPAFEPA